MSSHFVLYLQHNTVVILTKYLSSTRLDMWSFLICFEHTHSDTQINARAHTHTLHHPIILFLLFLSLYLPLLHPIHLSFAISICSNDIYLASWECPSAIRHNKSYKYQPSSRGSCNIYGGNVAVGDVNSVYGEQVEHPSKVRRHMPTFSMEVLRCQPIQRAQIHATQRSPLARSHLACFSDLLITCKCGQPQVLIILGWLRERKTFETGESLCGWPWCQ